MSQDLKVIGSGAFGVESFAEWIGSLGGWEVATDGSFMWVRRVLQGGSELAFSLEGPLRVESEDLPMEVAAAVLIPQWLVEINVPAETSNKVWRMALRTGRRLADEMSGVLFDPQQDEIVWPRSRQGRTVAATRRRAWRSDPIRRATCS